MTDSTDIRQHVARQDGGLRASLELIPPLAEGFWVYGGDDTLGRAREWALRNRYLLASGIPKCAHGLYLLGMCPNGDECRSAAELDHADVWIPSAPEYGRPFLLHHPYHDALRASTKAYAAAHGLDLQVNRQGDEWYGPGTLAVRLTVPQDWPLWPIEAAATVLLHTQPVTWPE